jgi:hypothetical protein
MLLILSPLKIHRLRAGLNPRTLGPMQSTITTRPPRATDLVVEAEMLVIWEENSYGEGRERTSNVDTI